MTPENFTYWLQGFFEINPDVKTLNEQQVATIRNHLSLVFDKVTFDPFNSFDVLTTNHTGLSSNKLC